MRWLVAALALLLSGAAVFAQAGDASVRIVVTNGGKTPTGEAWFGIYAPGEHDNYLSWGSSGQPVTVAEGRYDIGVHLEKGAAKKVIWLEAQELRGTYEKTVEMAFAMADVTYGITNGGVDLDGKAWFGIYPAGDHGSYIAWAHSGGEVTVPAGTYDVGIEYTEGEVVKNAWIEGQKLEGTVRRTHEMGATLARLQVVITNGGKDVGQRAWFGLYRPGDRGQYVTWGWSGQPVSCEAGTYDLGLFYEEGEVRHTKWLSAERIEGTVKRSEELALPIATIVVKVTNGGVDAASKGRYGLYQPGEREVTASQLWEYSGKPLTIPQGTYDIGVFFEDGTVKLSKWLPAEKIEGKTERTVEMGAALADLKVRITRGGQRLEGAWFGLYPAGDMSTLVTWSPGDQWLRTAEGTYDVGCFYEERGLTASKWIKGQALKGKVELDAEIDLRAASLTITSGAAAGGAQAPGAATTTNLELILDASGSMWAQVEGKPRIEVAKAVLRKVVDTLPAQGVKVALRLYGTAPKAKNDCKDSTLVVPLGPPDKAALVAAIDAVKPSGHTPIAFALEQAGNDLPKDGRNALVLVTDGIESCKGDPCAVASRLAAQGILARSFVVGFGLGRDKGRLLDCIGRYYPAASQAELEKALGEAIRESVKPVTGTVTLFAPGKRERAAASGSLDQEIVAPAGSYDVVIKAGGREIVWPAFALSGSVKAPLADKPPASSPAPAK